MKKMLVLAACFGMAAGFVACSDNNNNDDPSAPEKAVVSGPDRNVWPETTVTLTATAAGAESFVWYNGSTPVPGATATTYSVTVSGYYSAAGKNAVGEGPKSDPKTVDISTTTVTLTGESANVCPETSVLLTASLLGADSFAWYLGETKLAATANTYSATVSGIYTVAGIIDGREGPKSGAIIVNITPCPAPAKATVTGNASNTCPATTVQLTATASGAESYVWYKDGAKINNATANTYSVNAPGSYTAAGVNAIGEGPQSDPKAVTITSCGGGGSVVLYNIDAETTDTLAWKAFNENTLLFDGDGDGNNWKLVCWNAECSRLARFSESFINNVGPLTPENYLILPGYYIGTNAKFTFTVQASNNDYAAEKFKVVVATLEQLNAATTEEEFLAVLRAADVLHTHTLANVDPYTQTLDIPASYNGKAVFVIVVHFDCTDQYRLFLTRLKYEHTPSGDPPTPAPTRLNKAPLANGYTIMPKERPTIKNKR